MSMAMFMYRLLGGRSLPPNPLPVPIFIALPTPPAVVKTAKLWPSATRAHIAWVQLALNRINESIPHHIRLLVDGLEGPKTKGAVRDFRKRFGVSHDEITEDALERVLAARKAHA